MPRIHLAADHGGYELARLIEAEAATAGIETVWHGPEAPDPGDDYPVHAIRVGKAVVEDQDAGVDAFAVLVVGDQACGVVAANKVNGARAVGTSSPVAAIALRKAIDANVLVLDGVAYPTTAWQSVYGFVHAPMAHSVENGRRILQIEEYENHGTIEGWAVQLEPEQYDSRGERAL